MNLSLIFLITLHMNYSLKDLQENKTQKEFKFLTPLKDVLIEKFSKEVVENDKLTREHLHEIMCKDEMKESIIAAYSSLEELRILRDYSNLTETSISETRKTRAKSVEEKVEVKPLDLFFRFNGKDTPLSYASHHRDYSSSCSMKLEDLYIVTDKKAFDEYILELLVAEEEKSKADIAKKAEKKREELIKRNEFCAKYGIKGKPTECELEAAKILEALDNGKAEERFKAVLELVKRGDCCGYCCDDY
jgi:hypothetical protein